MAEAHVIIVYLLPPASPEGFLWKSRGLNLKREYLALAVNQSSMLEKKILFKLQWVSHKLLRPFFIIGNQRIYIFIV